MIQKDEGNENEFERVEQLVKVEIKVRDSHLICEQLRHQEIDYEQQKDVYESREWDLEANPILPPDKHHCREQPRLKLKYGSSREKLNRTTFVATGLTERKTNNVKDNYFSLLKGQLKTALSLEEQVIGQNEECDRQFLAIMQSCTKIYRRMNNSSLNSLGKQRVLNSIFFDWRKQKINSKTEPIYQYLSRIKKISNAKSQSHQLSFNSSFESGNLLLAVLRPNAIIPTYQLHMQNDVNTKGCTQWYYFSVSNRVRGKAKFRIMNFYKPTSLYQRGMKILCSWDKNQWKKTGTSITYSKYSEQKHLYALQFIHEFEAVGKTTYFAYGYPYTYGEHLSEFIENLFSDNRDLKNIQKSNLCLSAMGNPIPMFLISNNIIKKEPKPIVYVIARQHPGETPASFIVQGLINFLLSASLQAKELRDRFEFKVVPMVNVDGVISGNYRSNLSGSDVNRQWQFPSKHGQPEVYWLKQEIGANRKQVAFFLDIHAHSRKMNSFFYGSKAIDRDNKLYPFICSKLNKFISYNDSSFSDDPSKKTTARVVLQNEFQILNSLTFQASFYGWVDSNKGKVYSFKQNDFRSIGQSLGMGFYYSLIGVQRVRKIEESKNNLPKFQTEKEKFLYKNSSKLLEKWKKELEKQAAENQEAEMHSQGSSLDPEHYQLKEEERQFVSEMYKLQMEKHKMEESQRNLSTPKKDNNKQRLLISSNLSSFEGNDSKLLAPKGQNANNKNLGISSNEFYHISSSARGQKKIPFSMRQLELELQGKSSPECKLLGMKFKMSKDNTTAVDRYQSLDVNRNDRVKNYKEDVLEMKRAFKYLLESKNSDYEQYRSCFKTYNNDCMSAPLRRSDQRTNK